VRHVGKNDVQPQRARKNRFVVRHAPFLSLLATSRRILHHVGGRNLGLEGRCLQLRVAADVLHALPDQRRISLPRRRACGLPDSGLEQRSFQVSEDCCPDGSKPCSIKLARELSTTLPGRIGRKRMRIRAEACGLLVCLHWLPSWAAPLWRTNALCEHTFRSISWDLGVLHQYFVTGCGPVGLCKVVQFRVLAVDSIRISPALRPLSPRVPSRTSAKRTPLGGSSKSGMLPKLADPLPLPEPTGATLSATRWNFGRSGSLAKRVAICAT